MKSELYMVHEEVAHKIVERIKDLINIDNNKNIILFINHVEQIIKFITLICRKIIF